MKKLPIIFLSGLILFFMVGHVFALSFKFDLDQDGVPDDPAEIFLYKSESIAIDIWLTDWTEDVNIAGVEYYFFTVLIGSYSVDVFIVIQTFQS